MGGEASLCSKAVVLLCLAQALLFRGAQSQGGKFRDHVLGPFSHFFWASPFPDPLPHPHPHSSFLAAIRRTPAKDLGPSIGKDNGPSHPAPLGDSLGSQPSRHLQQNRPQLEDPPAKRPLDSVGSGFLKRAQAEGQAIPVPGAKRDLDRLGTGLLKRPLDRLGSGFLKKRLPLSEGADTAFHKREPEEGAPQVTSDLPAEERREAVSLLKRGLDTIGIGLLKRQDSRPDVVTLIRQGLQELSTALGSGRPSKEVDVDMVRSGLEHVGAGFLQQGMDTEGLGLVKRGVDALQEGLAHSSRELRERGARLLRAGLQDVAAVMRKHGVSSQALALLASGAERLAAWLVSHPASADPDSSGPRLATQGLQVLKKSFDEIGSGFLKKDVGVKKSEDDDDVKRVDKKSFEEARKELLEKELYKKSGRKFKSAFRTNSLDRIGTGFIKKASLKPQHTPSPQGQDQQFPGKPSSAIVPKHAPKHTGKTPHKKPSGDKKASSNQKRPEHSKTPARKEKPDPKAVRKMEELTKARQLEQDMKDSPHRSDPPVKKDLDEIGIGLIKKDLDYIGAGLIKKRQLQPAWDQGRGSLPSAQPGHPLWHPPAAEKNQNGKNQAPEIPLASAKSKMNPKSLASMKA